MGDQPLSLACPAFIGNLAPGLCRAVEDYCQLTGPGWDADTLNTWANAAFLIAAFAGWRMLSVSPNAKAHLAIRALTLLAALAGIGGYLFHTSAAPWAKCGETVPILAFMLLYVWLLLRRFFHWNVLIAIPVLALYAAAIYWLETRAPGSAPFGRAMNLPTLVLFLLAAVGFLMRLREAFWPMIWALGILLASSAASMAEAQICPQLGLATHAVWHLLDALLLYVLLRLAVLHAPKR
jgi:hypothetical protein